MTTDEYRIDRDDGNIKVYTPYNPSFVRSLKTIGSAHFSWDEKCWVLPERYIDDVRARMREYYGRDDIESGETVDVEVAFCDDYEQWRDGVRLGYRTLAYATGRDSGAKVGEGVTLVTGKIGSGGSRNNWTTVVWSGAVFRVDGVQKSLLNKLLDGKPFDGAAKITVLDSVSDRQQLLEEQARLKARLAEIEKLLQR